MSMKKVFVVVFLAAIVITSAVLASSWPDDLTKTMMTMKADAEAKKDMPPSLSGIQVVNGEEAHKLFKSKKAVFLDNRVKTQYDTEKIQGAEWFFCDELLKNPALADKLDKSKEYVVYCNGTHCWRSPATALMLQHLGFKKIHWYREGIPDWKKRGYPTE